jgi:poly-gamma-glutamate capsule biosynthesis protein CapA/YwtB (metallophosphatase superfamily)
VGDGVVTLFLCGDVMTGRGIDQVLPHPGDPELREAYVRDARAYVDLAERAHGPIPRPVSFGWPWGEALGMLADIGPDVRVINLETSITASGEFAPGKAVHYRMSPGNTGCVAAARPDACALANNHVLDFGHRGLAAWHGQDLVVPTNSTLSAAPKSEPVWLGVPALRRFQKRPGFGWPCQQAGDRLGRQWRSDQLGGGVLDPDH